MILLIDNYDSFSYNLYQYLGEIESDIKVIRNDDMTVEEIEAMAPRYIVLSPGPGRPENAGVCIDVVRKMEAKSKILGICLGHQAICAAYGAKITYAKQLMHGKQSTAEIENEGLFAGLPKKIEVARYHSLAAEPGSIPPCLKVTAKTKDGEIMAVKHREYEVYGLQFHPESVMTPAGKTIIKNFLSEN